MRDKPLKLTSGEPPPQMGKTGNYIMKYLSDYMGEKQTKLFKQTGAFFAFSKSQYEESAKPNINYKSLASGMICPEKNIDFLSKKLDTLKQIQTEIHKIGEELQKIEIVSK